MEFHTDYLAPQKYVVILGMNDTAGLRFAAYEIGIWDATEKGQAFSFGERALGRPVTAVLAEATSLGKRADDYDPGIPVDEFVHGVSVEEFTDTEGTGLVYDRDETWNAWLV